MAAFQLLPGWALESMFPTSSSTTSFWTDPSFLPVLKDVVIQHPLVSNGLADKETVLDISFEKGNEWKFSVYRNDSEGSKGDNGKLVFATGKLSSSRREIQKISAASGNNELRKTIRKSRIPATPKILEVPKITDRCTQVDVKWFYQQLRSLGVNYGKTFQRVSKLWYSKVLSLLSSSLPSTFFFLHSSSTLSLPFSASLLLHPASLHFFLHRSSLFPFASLGFLPYILLFLLVSSPPSPLFLVDGSPGSHALVRDSHHLRHRPPALGLHRPGAFPCGPSLPP
jgi:hypothetical protein